MIPRKVILKVTSLPELLLTNCRMTGPVRYAVHRRVSSRLSNGPIFFPAAIKPAGRVCNHLQFEGRIVRVRLISILSWPL